MVGFYGGINYGFGYFGEGYEGGRWDHDRFFYNRSVNNVNETVVHNVYNTTVISNNETHVRYNGGDGGINRRPTPQEEAAARERHIPPVPVQTQHAQAARTNPQQRASLNMGKPPVAATPKPGAWNDRAVVPAKAPGAPYTPPANRAANRGGSQPRNNASAPANPAPRPENSAPRPDNNASRPSTPVHPRYLPPAARPGAPNTGDPKLDQKYQQQQEKVFAQQEQERQKLQQQEQEHQRLTNKTPVKRQSSRWSRSTSNRRSNCSKSTNSSDSRWSSDSSHRRIGIGPILRTRAVLRLKTLIVHSTSMKRELSEAFDNRVPRSVQEDFSEARAIKEFRRTGCVTRLDAVPLRTSLKQEKRQKPVPHHRPASTGRKSIMIEFARASGAPFRLPRLGALQI